MTENTDKESLEHIRDSKTRDTNYLVRNDPDIKGEVDIEVRENGRFDITVYKGDSNKPNNVEDISKERLIELIDEQL